MSYQVYSGLSTPDDVLQAMATYVSSRGYNIVDNCVTDLNIYDQGSSDGLKLVFQDRNSEYFYILRSANGTNIFGTTDNGTMNVTVADRANQYNGIGLIISEGYSRVQRWYDQFHIPLNYNGIQPQCVFMPVGVNGVDNQVPDPTPTDPNHTRAVPNPLGYTYSLYCNNVTEGNSNADVLVFSLVKENDTYLQCAHLVMGTLSRYSNWTGGAFFSGSALPSMIGNSWRCFLHEKDADSYILPVLCSGEDSNTFLRINIDNAPADSRHNIFWASSGRDNITGKRLSLPIRKRTYGNNGVLLPTNGKIPNYFDYQSNGRLDWGRNVNTLNCISINLPIYMAVQRDPDGLNVYSAAGQIIGVYFVCMLNMQTSHTYEINYPQSGDMCQVFPMGKRRGVYGFDGISVRQDVAGS